MKIYIVTSGVYPEYCVGKVFITREKAAEFCAACNKGLSIDHYRVEEYDAADDTGKDKGDAEQNEQCLIDKANVLKGLEELKQSPFVNSHDSYVRHMMRETLDVVAKLVIEAEPIAEARKHGTWKCYYLTPLTEKFSQCSECGAGACSPSWNYCPHCGAKMRKGEQE